MEDSTISMNIEPNDQQGNSFMPNSMNMEFEPLHEGPAKIKVIGVGGGGGNAVNHMYRQGIHGVEFIVCNTDKKALDASPVPNKITLGKLGAGNVPEHAREMALKHKDEIRDAISNDTQMLFITAGMGGGTGTGAAPIIAEIAKSIELDDDMVNRILVVAIVTEPFSFEGSKRKKQAIEGIEELRKHVDAILVINNDKLRKLGNLTLKEAFTQADDVLLTAAKGIAEIITVSAYVNIDFRDVNTVMEKSGTALMGAGEGRGENRARQAIEAFRRSQRPDGLTNSDAPTQKSNVIPGFSIYYILMVYDHMMYFGDRELVRRNWGAIDQVLEFFGRHIAENGMVGKIGGPLIGSTYWSFIDWTNEWNQTMGVPSSTNKGTGALTMESLLYAYGLEKAAEMSDFIGRTGVAEEYRSRARSVLDAVKKHAMGTYTDAQGHTSVLLEDGPGVKDFSVHPQVFAVLTGLVTPEEGRKMLEVTIGNPDMAQSSVSYMFYLFRALEMTGWYEKTDDLWELWRKMVREHMSTCVENGTDSRSDCHAWSALMLYELPCAVLGVTPAAPGFRKMNIHPHAGALRSAKGDVITPVGTVHVEWSLNPDGEMSLSYQAPDGVEVMSPEN